MRSVTKFQSDDGALFDTPEEALKRDSLLARITEVQRVIPRAKDEHCRFSHGHGFITHNPEAIARFHEAIAAVLEDFSGKVNAQMFRDNPHGIIHRIIDDSGSPIQRLLWRVNCIDEQQREWGQPYYANHPEQGEQIEWKELV